MKPPCGTAAPMAPRLAPNPAPGTNALGGAAIPLAAPPRRPERPDAGPLAEYDTRVSGEQTGARTYRVQRLRGNRPGDHSRSGLRSYVMRWHVLPMLAAVLTAVTLSTAPAGAQIEQREIGP